MEITWPNGRVRRRVAGGVDSTQALMLGFSLVCSDFLVSETPIYWFEEHDDLSLPNVSVLAGDVAARKARFDSKDKTVPPSTSEC
ncbi:MAG: hypothetical protein PSX79_04050 [bacterium]|nr:hypothetical protein [bacterium]